MGLVFSQRMCIVAQSCHEVRLHEQRALRELVSIRDAQAYEPSGVARTVSVLQLVQQRPWPLPYLFVVIFQLALKLCLREATCLQNT